MLILFTSFILFNAANWFTEVLYLVANFPNVSPDLIVYLLRVDSSGISGTINSWFILILLRGKLGHSG